MLERLQGDAAHCALLHGGEHRVPQLAEAGRGEPDQAVDDDQADRHRQHMRGGAAVGERIDRAGVEDGHIDVSDLGQHQEGHRDHDAEPGACVVLGPEIRRQRLDRIPVGPGFAWQGQSVRRHHSHGSGCGMGRLGFKGWRAKQGRKQFFFEKKNQKTFSPRLHLGLRRFCRCGPLRSQRAALCQRSRESLSVLSFVKEPLGSSLAVS